MSRTWLGISAVIVILASTVFFEFSRAANAPKNTGIAEGQFSGKVLVVSTKSSDDFGAQLENAQVKRLGDELFLVGTSFYDGEEGAWSDGRTLWISMDDVSQIVEFKDRAELKKADEKSRRSETAAMPRSTAIN